MKIFWSGFGQFMGMWFFEVGLMFLLLYLMKADAAFYFLAPFAAIILSMIGVIGSNIDERKEKRIRKHKTMLSGAIEDLIYPKNNFWGKNG